MSHDECADQMTDKPRKKPLIVRMYDSFYNMFDKPTTWFRESIVDPNREQYPYYHRKFRRVPTVDQCYTDDIACLYEADQQFKRDKLVEAEITGILRNRVDDCLREEFPDFEIKCNPLQETYEVAAAAWFAKYGDLGAQHSVITAFMKQKHRMIWERRHGKVGGGMRMNKYVEATRDTEH